MIKGMINYPSQKGFGLFAVTGEQAAEVQKSQALAFLNDLPEVFEVTGSRFMGYPKMESDFDFIFMGDGYSSYGFTLSEKLRKRFPDYQMMSSYASDIEEASSIDSDLLYVIRIVDGITSIDIQFVGRPVLRVMCRDFLKKNFHDWAQLKSKDKKAAAYLWNVAKNHCIKTFKYKYLTKEMR